ncbi:MAG: hypothetical protein AB1473_15290 [Thermodesulfobacteriota bacterium]
MMGQGCPPPPCGPPTKVKKGMPFMPPPGPCFMPPCPPKCGPNVVIEPMIYLGYVWKDRGVGLKAENDAAPVLGLLETRHDYDLSGFWLEVAIPVSFDYNYGLMVSGAHLFPAATTSRQTYNLAAGGGGGRRDWNTDIQWWNVQAAGSYSFWRGVNLLAGYRWDSFMTKFTSPSDLVGIPGLNTDQADLTVSAHIPFIGIQLDPWLSCETFTKVGFVGFPVVLGSVIYKEGLGNAANGPAALNGNQGFDSGYFMEAYGEGGMKMANWNVGGFVKYSTLHATSKVDLEASLAADGTAQQRYNFTFDRRNWIFGGKIGVAF